MSAPSLRAALPICLPLAIACGPDPYADISGSVGGEELKAQSFFWGEPYIVLSSEPFECMDMAWVKRGANFETGGAPPTDSDMTALLFTYEDTDVVAGSFSVEGDAPIDARLLVVSNGALTVYKARTGALDVDSVEAEEHAVGSFELGFDEGSLSGEFEVEWCNNLKSRT
jgi:hypothetical protein